MGNRFTDTREALWDALKEYPALQKAKRDGTLFEFNDDGALVQMHFTPGQCPIMAMYPGPGWQPPEISRKPRQHWHYPVQVELVEQGPDAGKIEQLFADFHAALQAACDSTTSLLAKVENDHGLQNIHMLNPSVQGIEESKSQKTIWRMSFTLDCVYRRIS